MADPVKYQPSHFGICITDLERSMRFYCDGLGFEPAERYDLEDWPDSGLDRGLEVQGPVKVVSQFIRSGGMGIELLFFESPKPSGTPSARCPCRRRSWRRSSACCTASRPSRTRRR